MIQIARSRGEKFYLKSGADIRVADTMRGTGICPYSVNAEGCSERRVWNAIHPCPIPSVETLGYFHTVPAVI